MKNKTLYAIVVIAIAFILFGQVLIYGVNPYHTEINFLDKNNGSIEYDISSNTSSNYDSLLLDVGMHIPDELMIYEDPDYDSHLKYGYIEANAALMHSELSLRNVNYSIVNAETIKLKLQSDIDNGAAEKRLFVPTGILPDTIYDGSVDSLILNWLKIGGVMYWAGYTLGVGISSTGEIYECTEGYGNKFLGIPDSDLRQDNKNLYSTEKARDYCIGKNLKIMYNDSRFGINTNNLTNFLSIGYTSDGYDSLVLSKYANGDGMIVVFGGDLAIYSAPIIAQVIASKLTYMSILVDHHSGKIFHSSVTEIMYLDPTKDYVLYIFVGLPQIYARAFDC